MVPSSLRIYNCEKQNLASVVALKLSYVTQNKPLNFFGFSNFLICKVSFEQWHARVLWYWLRTPILCVSS